MSFGDLLQQYFERSVALQWYWTVYVLVIGGVLGFSTFRQRPELITTILVTLLYLGFAYKNAGAIESTAEEREAIRAVLKDVPATPDVTRVREKLDPTIPPYDIAGAKYFHLFCDLLTIAFLWAKEWRRRNPEAMPVSTAN